MHQIRIIVTTPNGVTEHVFTKFPVFLGRLPSNEVQLRDTMVSRIHAKLECDEEAIVVSDMGSENGTLILFGSASQELRSRQVRVRTGEVELRLGDTMVRAKRERMGFLPISTAVVAAAHASSVELRRARSSFSVPIDKPDVASARRAFVLDSILGGVASMKRSLESGPHEGSRASSEREAEVALLGWVHELLVSLEKLRVEPAPALDATAKMRPEERPGPTSLLEGLD